MRMAQFEICAYGTSALPRLRQSVLASNDPPDVRALCCYLIGDIDPNAYRSVLIDATKSGRVEAAIRYPNPEAIQSLSAKDQEGLLAELSYFQSEASEGVKEMIRSITHPQR